MISKRFAWAAQIIRNRVSVLHGYRSVLALLGFAWLLGPSAGLVKGQSYLESAGVPPFAKQLPVEKGWIDASNGRLHLEIPMGSYAQRGGRVAKLVFMYDSNIWEDTYWSWQPDNVSWDTAGWRVVAQGDYSQYTTTDSGYCAAWDDYSSETYNRFIYVAPDGTQHSFNIDTTVPLYPADCPAENIPSGNAFASDGSGYYMSVSDYTVAVVYAPDGTQLSFAWAPEDPNGNHFGDGSDSLGRTLITTTPGTNQVTYTVPSPSGGTSNYTVHTGTINVSTNFGQTYVSEYASTITVVTSIDLPDGSSYTFDYDSGTAAGHYGQLTSMTLPTNGQVTYSWSPFTDAQGNNYTWITGRVTSDGTWTYTPSVVGTPCSTGHVNCTQTFTVQKPLIASSRDTTVYTFALNGGAWSNQIDYYTGSSTLVATTTQCWNFVTITSGTCTYSSTSGGGATGVQKLAETTTLPIPGSSISRTTEYTYDSYGNTTQMEEWNFYTGTLPSSPSRTTNTVYLTGTSYFNANILNRPTSVTVLDADGSTTVAQTIYSYDQGSLTSVTGMPNHDDTNYTTSNNIRGNVTEIQKNSGSSYISSSMTYDSTGEVQTSTDFNSNQTSYAYSGTYYNAYPTTATNPLSQSTTMTYDFNTGLLASITDPNGNPTYFAYDNMERPLTTSYPDGGETSIAYNYNTSNVYTGRSVTQKITSSLNAARTDAADELGRLDQTRLTSDPDGTDYTDTIYDSHGRVASVSNPYRSMGDPTYGVETPAYDGLDRVTQITHADSASAQSNYGAADGSGVSQGCSSSTYGLGYPILYQDEAGNKRQTWTDGFGRIIETDEPNASGTLSPKTCYTYDANNNLTGVLAADGTQTRSYTSDMLSRMTSKTEPETGTTNLYYTTSGGSLCSGDLSALCRRTDARSITTSYSYDALNRITAQQYSDGTPGAYYAYDQSSPWGFYLWNHIGRLTTMFITANDSTNITAAAFGYDAMGRVTSDTHSYTNQATGVYETTYYTYNLDGTIAAMTYPSGRTVTYAPGGAQRPLSAKDTSNSINYAEGSSYAMYSPQGAPANIVYGYVSSGGFTGVTETRTYNNRLEITGIEAISSAATALHLSFSYVSGNNGNVSTQTNSLDTGRTQSYTYDTLNRLLTAQTAATSGGDCWGQSFGNNATPPTLAADALANLFYSTSIQCSSPQPRFTLNGSNHFTDTGFSYDAAGNNTADGAYSYTYDPENRIATTSGMSGGPYCYIYDAKGLRVGKAQPQSGYDCNATGTHAPTVDVLNFRDLAGNTIEETDSTGSTSNSNYHEYIFFAGRRVARSDVSSSNVYYYFADQLGSTRAMTTAAGSVCFKAEYYPYGQELDYTTTCNTSYKFTGYERDAETGNDYAFARYYNPRLGRFMSGDPLAGDLSDPQTLNRYAYVRNNPVNLFDPSGMAPCSHDAYCPVDPGNGTDSPYLPIRNRSNPDCLLLGGGCPPTPAEAKKKPQTTAVRATRDTDNLPSCAQVALAAITGAFSFKAKLGLEAQVANFGIDASLYKDVSTKETGMQLSLNLGVFGGQVSRTLSPGNSGADPTRPQFIASLGAVEHNFTTSQTDPSVTFGLALGLGGEITFSFDTLRALAATPCTNAR